MFRHQLSRLLLIATTVLGTMVTTSAAPGEVTDLTVSYQAPHAIALSWTSYDSADFKRYEVRRSSSAGVSTADQLVSSITSSETTSATDPDLVAYSVYHYRVFVVDTNEVYSAGVELSARTSASYFPFNDMVDGTDNSNFSLTESWAITENSPGDGDAHTGSYHWSDSPAGNYAPSSSSTMMFTVNLGTATMPVLRFWERYAFQTNVDFGFVEVSRNGTSWEQVSFVTGSQTIWKEKRIDLTQWTGYGEIRIRFRMAANTSTESDGWHIDDVTVTETPKPTLPFPFVETFEDTTRNWIASSWEVYPDGHESTNRITDSDRGNYSLLSRNILVSSGVFDLSGTTNPVLTFWHRYDMYTNHGYHQNEDDWARVYVSADYGRPGSWVQVKSWTGAQASWTRVQVDLTTYRSTSVRVMFKILDNPDNYSATDALNRTSSGWDLDDIRIEELPEKVALGNIVSSSMHHAELNWVQNTDGDFERYEIYRATSTSITRSSTLIKVIRDQSVTSWIDTIAMIQPTDYSYRMYAIDTLETVGLGSDVKTAEYSVPVTAFPFQDSMNANTANWAYGYAWGPTTETYHSPPSSWTDSPGASYSDNTNSALATFVNLSGSAEPVLTFWQRYDLETNADYGYVEVSTDAGNAWTLILRVTGSDTTWQRERISLDRWKGQTIGLRFRLAGNSSASQDGWYIDDVAILNSDRVMSYPFTDDVESDTTAWFTDSPWGSESTNSHSGSRHWSDSPSGDYAANTSSSLMITVNLSGATMPMLSYYERFSFEPNADWGFVEISTNGTSWTQSAFVTGIQSDWAERRVDLSDVAGTSEVRIRFRIVTNSGSNSDGWHIDDIRIDETPTPTLPFPFVEAFDSTNASNWITSGWTVVTGGTSGLYEITDSPLGNYPLLTRNRLVSAGVFDLSAATHPVLTFWHNYSVYTNHGYHQNEDDWIRVYASYGYGHSGTWVQLLGNTSSNGGWTRVQLDMEQFAGKSAVRLIFRLDDNIDNYYATDALNRTSGGWHIDDIRLEELPVDVAINTITSSSLHHVALSWSQNQDDDFDRYEIYRSTSPDVTRSSTLIKTTTDQATTSWTDTISLIQPTQYSYRVYVYDIRGTVSMGSNVITATYTVPTNTFPFSDSMAVNTDKWNWSAPWGPVTDVYHSAPSAWKSDPVQAYKPNANSALTTFVNLGGGTAPVLTFWHRYAFEAGVDYGRVEISTNGGSSWTQVLAVTSVDDEWNQERVDLGPYAGETIGLRFRVTSNATTQMNGWYLDDIVISNGVRSVEFPWSDDTEAGVGPWFPSSPWGLSNIGSHSGQWHWTDSPAGNYSPSQSTSLVATIDLGRATSPVLRFWQRYSFEPNADWGYVEVSTNGGASWTQVYFVTGSAASWRQDEVDLSAYTGNAGVKVRFRLASNGSNQSDGWHIDDIEFLDVIREISYPFADNFDDTTAVCNWISSSWELISGGRSGPYQYHDSPLGNYAQSAWSSLTLAGHVDLRGTENPILTFWHRYYMYTNHGYHQNEDDWIRVYVSPDNGQVWNSVYAVTNVNGAWSKVTINLKSYVGQAQLRVRFVLDDNVDNYYSTDALNRVQNGWFLDDVRIGEDITLGTLADSARLEGPALVHSAPGLASPQLIGRIYEPGVTTVAGQGPGVIGQFGIGEPGTMANDTTWNWFAGGYLNDLSGAERFTGAVIADEAGTYSVAFRASIDGGATWIYADLDGNNLAGGGVNEYRVDKAGTLVVGFGAGLIVDSRPVAFEIRSGGQDIWGFAIGNSGPDPLTWSLSEGQADSTLSDIPWLNLQQTNGRVDAAQKATPSFMINATDLQVDSLYIAQLLLTSNDAVRDSVWIPVHMTVLSPDINGFTGYVRAYGGVEVTGGVMVVSELDDTPIDTLPVAAGGRFMRYGVMPGTYRLSVRAEGTYRQEVPKVTLPIEGLVINVSPHHVAAASPFFMNLFSEASTLDGDDLPVGTVVTVRDDDGILCGISVVKTAGMYGLLHVYADDPITSVDEGASIGDTLRIFVNDVPAPQYAIYTGHNVVRRLNLVAGTSVAVHLPRGLTLASFPVAPRDSVLVDVLSSIAGKYSYIAGFDTKWGGARVYVDSLKPFSDLNTVDGVHGYWIRMEEAGDVAIRGGRIHDDAPMQLERGWNLVSFLPGGAVAPEEALRSILPALTTVGGFDNGAQTYVPGEPFSDLRMMQYGRGYWMHMRMPALLTYRGAELMPLAKVATEVVEGPVPTREWMDVYGVLTIDGKAAPESTVVTVRDASGVVCGETLVRQKGFYGFVHAYGDDPVTERDEGPLPGETLQILVNGSAVIGAPTVTWLPGLQVVRLDLAVNMSPTGVASARPWEFRLDNPRPNPFNPITSISYELATRGEVSLVIYNQLGQRVRTLVSGVAPPGRYLVSWNGKDDLGRHVASGAFLVRLRSGTRSRVNRVVLVR